MPLIRFAVWAISEIINRAEDEWYSPEAIRYELSHLQYLLENNEIAAEEFRQREQKLFERLKEGRERGIEE